MTKKKKVRCVFTPGKYHGVAIVDHHSVTMIPSQYDKSVKQTLLPNELLD